jgi:hypothetical protein
LVLVAFALVFGVLGFVLWPFVPVGAVLLVIQGIIG